MSVAHVVKSLAWLEGFEIISDSILHLKSLMHIPVASCHKFCQLALLMNSWKSIVRSFNLEAPHNKECTDENRNASGHADDHPMLGWTKP